jgi:spermidine synthase
MRSLAWLLSFAVGFLSLSQEILWVRVAGFAFQTIPQAFAFVLAMFLAGISLGALIGKVLCNRLKNLSATAGWALFLSGLLDLSLVINIPVMFSSLSSFGLGLLVFIGATLKGIIFPIAHHIGSEISSQLGRSVSWVYFMNIAGSTLGPLIVGLVLLDVFSITASFQLLAASVLLTATCVLLFVATYQRDLFSLGGSISATILVVLIGQSLQTDDRRLIEGLMAEDKSLLKTVIENRHGIIHTVKGEREGDDIVYGGNVYDGRTNIDLRINSNRIDRAYILHTLHSNPRRVLMIGLSTGAWTRILSANPDIDSIDVVEINPGYLQLIQDYKHLSPLLDDNRVSLHIDDGRRWLRHHPQLKFDLIVMNTTFHWRANTTNLVSQEMLTLVNQHLNQGGVFAFNATGSDDVFFTASQVFPHAYRYRNFIYASDHDFRASFAQAEAQLLKLKFVDKAVFNAKNRQDVDAIKAMLAIPFESIDNVKIANFRALETVTDQNMITEYKYGRRLF